MPTKGIEASYVLELRALLDALDNFFINGESGRLKLEQLLEKHGFDLNEPIGNIDIVSGFCKRYNLEAQWDEKGYLQIRRNQLTKEKE